MSTQAPIAPPARRTTGLRAKKRRLPFSGWHFVLVPTAILFAIPLVQMSLASLSPAAELLKFPHRSCHPA